MAQARRYLAVSPVRNESTYLQRTIDSMVAQTVRPAIWMIVDDGSSDETPTIAQRAVDQHSWIRFHRRADRGVRKVGGGVVEAFDDTGAPIEPAALSWSVEPFRAGDFPIDARFVGYQPGPVEVIVSHGSLADTVALEIQARAVAAGSLTTVGHGPQVGPCNTDLWVHGNIAYTGTFSRGSNRGNRIFIWDVATPANPMLLGSFVVDAAAVNDVKLRPDGWVAVLTHEGSTDGRNGISLVDVRDPTTPRLITRFVDGLELGVHNAWYQGQYLYLAVNDVAGLHVLDVSNAGTPRRVARFYAGSSFVHDVHVRDGLAFVSHWDAGLIILDVGNGVAGGSPTDPVEVGRIVIPGVKVHNAWYWPERRSVLIGDEFTRPGACTSSMSPICATRFSWLSFGLLKRSADLTISGSMRPAASSGSRGTRTASMPSMPPASCSAGWTGRAGPSCSKPTAPAREGASTTPLAIPAPGRRSSTTACSTSPTSITVSGFFDRSFDRPESGPRSKIGPSEKNRASRGSGRRPHRRV